MVRRSSFLWREIDQALLCGSCSLHLILPMRLAYDLGRRRESIREKLQLARMRDHFQLDERWAVRPEDLSQALLDLEPRIVHFSGHGTSAGAVCLEDKLGRSCPVEPDALAALFELVADKTQCVVLNACYSQVQANAIAKHIQYVIGMNQAIGDSAAIAFAVGFYQALGGDRSVEDAYKFGLSFRSDCKGFQNT